MPTYVYARKAGSPERQCDVCAVNFERVQKMSDEPLDKCPQCGGEVERVILAPSLNGVGKLKTPSESSLAKAGFVQYKKKGKGYYEKSFGKGPDSIHG